MQCPHCYTSLDAETIFCGNCGRQVAPLHAQGATLAASLEQTQPAQRTQNSAGAPHALQSLRDHVPAPQRPYAPVPGKDKEERFSPAPIRVAQKRKRRVFFVAALLLLLVVVVLGGVLALMRGQIGGSTELSAQVLFHDSQQGQGKTDALNIKISGLGQPASGSHYQAWLVDEQKEQTLPLGTLQAQGQTFALDFVQQGVNLLGSGNKIEVTQEQGNAQLPTGKVALSAAFPPLALIHIKHLLFSFPTTPDKTGLLVGLLSQARLLNTQAQLLNNREIQNNTLALQCVAQSISDILEGSGGAQRQSLPSGCQTLNISAIGDGFGLLGTTGYLTLAAGHASLAATQPDTTDTIKQHAQQVITATNSIKGWATTLDQDVHSLRTSPKNTAVRQEIVTLGSQVLNGIDQARADRAPDQAGAASAYSYGQLMATLTLHTGA